MDDRIICITGNEPIPNFFKEEIKAPRVILVGYNPDYGRKLAARLSDAMLANDLGQRVDDYWGPTPCCEEDGFPSINPDCETDHGERTNRKLKDQPFYRRGHDGRMRKW